MSSPRPTPSALCLDPRTFGDAPAAVYLAEVLNQRQDRVLARKVAKVLAELRELVADVARAHLEYDALSTRSFARLLPMLSAQAQVRVPQALAGHDPLVMNLTMNVAEGAVKTWKRRVEQARRQEKQLARELPPGTPVQWVPAKPVQGEVTPDLLRERSKRFLRRKGKRDTLY